MEIHPEVDHSVLPTKIIALDSNASSRKASAIVRALPPSAPVSGLEAVVYWLRNMRSPSQSPSSKNSMGLNLYLLRHGETVYSQSGGYCGDLDPELTAAGLEMSKAFAASYSSLPWSAVYASPMQRTIATAKPLCESAGIEMQLRDGLKEIRYGEWEGKTTEWVKQYYASDYVRWLTEPAWNSPTGGETAVQIASRASLVIAEIEAQYPDGHVLVVSHKATLRIILCGLLGLDLGRYRDRIDMPACALNIVKFAEHGPMLVRLGDRSYMPKSLQDLPGT